MLLRKVTLRTGIAKHLFSKLPFTSKDFRFFAQAAKLEISARICYHARMDILVSHSSALQFWRTAGDAFLKDRRARIAATKRAQKVLDEKERPCLAGGNRRPAGCTLPVQVLVSDAQARTESSAVVSTLWSVPLPEKSLIDLGQGFLVSTPEFCFLQMASRCSVAQLIQLGCELCGTYALAEGGPARRREVPLTTIAKLKAFVESAPKAKGRAKALRALRYVMENSASPMETVLALLLCLPYRLGGYGIDRPALNYRVSVPRRMRKLADRAYCECDLCWPSANLAVEYDSKLYHTEPERQESDTRRRGTLVSLGFTVITVSRGQVMDGGAFNRLAHQVANQVGKRLRYVDPEFTRKHIALRTELFEAIAVSEG